MLGVAFKEWAVVCRALAAGRQAVILRKGGIAEAGGQFRPDHPRFWLYPTHFHEQQQKGIKPEAAPLLEAAEADRPPARVLRLTHWADVAGVAFVDRLDAALALDPLHVWAADTVRQRFHYRAPGLYVLTVRVFRAAGPVDVPEHPAYEGCKTWVELADSIPEEPAEPVLAADAFDRVAEAVGRLAR